MIESHPKNRSRHSVVDRPLSLFKGVLSLIPVSSSLSDETLIHGPCLHMTLAVGGTLSTNSLTQPENTEKVSMTRNATIIDCRLTHGTVRRRRRTQTATTQIK